MITIVKGRQRKGKTTVAVAIALWLVMNAGYKTSEIYSVVRLFHPNGEELSDYHFMTIAQMRSFVREMIEKSYTHIILIIDEIDRVFPHRFWNRFEQTEALLGLWQDEKLFNWIIGTAHLGKSIDLLIRESMQIEIIAEIDKTNDLVNLVVMNALDLEIYPDVLYNARFVQKLFNSWQPVK
jgi:SpoVK/Ycf46/Vps4 family AAA+-type ATPase